MVTLTIGMLKYGLMVCSADCACSGDLNLARVEKYLEVLAEYEVEQVMNATVDRG